jgi:hypothetical protein
MGMKKPSAAMLNDDQTEDSKPTPRWYHEHMVELCIAAFLLIMAVLNHFFG